MTMNMPTVWNPCRTAGESSLPNARTMRRELIARGFPKQLISAEGYWRPGRVGGHDHVGDEHA